MSVESNLVQEENNVINIGILQRGQNTMINSPSIKTCFDFNETKWEINPYKKVKLDICYRNGNNWAGFEMEHYIAAIGMIRVTGKGTVYLVSKR